MLVIVNVEPDSAVSRLIFLIDGLTERLGNAIAWLSFAMMLITFGIVALRYVIQSGNLVFFQESVIYLHATAFMLGAAWTLKRNGHVRVDVIYRKLDARAKSWIDSLGTLLFLLPVAVFLLLVSIEYVDRSWSIRETSAEPGGIPAVFLLKSLIPLMAILMILQAIAELLRNLLTLMEAERD